MNGKNQQESQQMQGSLTQGVVWEVGLGHGVGLTMADDNLPAKFHLDPFIRFTGIYVSVQFGAKTQWWVILGENLREKGLTAVNLY